MRPTPPRRVLFVHPNSPGQFRHLAPRLAADRWREVVFLTRGGLAGIPGVRVVVCRSEVRVARSTHPCLQSTEGAVRTGEATLHACRRLAGEGFVPDLVVAHPGWGDALFLREAFAGARIVLYCEYFWRAEGADVGFADAVATDEAARCRLRMRNAPLLVALESADALYAPTAWQRDLHPAWLRPQIAVIHDGIDLDRLRPDPAARFPLPDGRTLGAEDEVLTYVARGLEPQRGFPQLMRALPALLARRPDLQVVICGSDRICYSYPPQGFATWREAMLAELGPLPPRVHFVGPLSPAAYRSLLQVSSLHLYLSVPFVLSWSMTEAMATGCLVLGSDTAPVREFVTDGLNGFLVEMRDPAAIAERAAALLADRAHLARVRAAARATIRARCALPDCLAAQEALMAGALPIAGAGGVSGIAARAARQSGWAMP